eukprot:jgi/Ulvmu1/8550/UM044_0084.1
MLAHNSKHREVPGGRKAGFQLLCASNSRATTLRCGVTRHAAGRHAGNEHSEAEAHISCWAGTLAETWAFAAARASVDGRCYRSASASAAADIEAAVDALTHSYDHCSYRQSGEGHSDAAFDGASGSRILDHSL